MAGGGKKAGASGSKELERFLGEFKTQSRPVREELFSQIAEALRTGGVGARLPIAMKSVEATKSAASNALTKTGESLASSGLAGTPFGESILANTRMQGELAVGQAPIDIANQFIGMAPNLVVGSGQTIGGMASSAAATGAAREASALQFFASLFGSGAQAGGSMGAAKALAPAAGCWIAEALFGRNTPKFFYARYWILKAWKGEVADRFRKWYRAEGERNAKLIRGSKKYREVWLPLFEMAAEYGYEAFWRDMLCRDQQ